MTEGGEPAMTVEKRLDKMGEDLHALRVSYEHHDEQIQRIAEVQGAHGTRLEEHGELLGEIKGELNVVKGELGAIKGALKPLPQIHDFVKRIANEHEARITALEKRAGG